MSRLTSRLVSVAVYSFSLLTLIVAIALYIQRTLASDLSEHWPLAAGFAVIPALAAFLVLLAVGQATRKFIEKRLSRQLRHPLARLWVAPMFSSVVIVAISQLQDRSTNTLFQERLRIAAPPSMHDFHYWWGTLPGDAEFVFKFKIDSTDFEQLLAGKQFLQSIGTDALDDAARESASVRKKRPDLALPDRFSTAYRFESSSPVESHKIVIVYTTTDRNDVLIYGDN